MLLPPRHLRPILHTHPIPRPVDIQRHAPEGAVFDFRDLKVDGFGDVACGVVDAEAHDA